MRRQFVKTFENIMDEEERAILLLGDIGVFGFRNAFQKHPERTINVGICEQSMTGMAAGLAKEGFIPVLHSIAPFIVERCFEQIKIDLCYQQLSAKIVSVGASYDYAALGCTHHCPGDVAELQAIPGLEIVVPGTAAEFDALFRQSYHNSHTTYVRLSEQANSESHDLTFGKAKVIRQGFQGTVIAVGPMLSRTEEALAGMDVTLLYYTTVVPFDAQTLSENITTGDIVVVEPFYEGTLAYAISRSLPKQPHRLLSIGVPREFRTFYGHPSEHDEACGLTASLIRERITSFFNERKSSAISVPWNIFRTTKIKMDI